MVSLFVKFLAFKYGAEQHMAAKIADDQGIENLAMEELDR
jgi:hypothetical protein